MIAELTGGFRPFRGRRKKTLVRVWRELNCWGWPKEVHIYAGSQPPDRDDKVRAELMSQVEMELGFRTICDHNEK